MSVVEFVSRLSKAEVSELCRWLNENSEYEFEYQGTRKDILSYLLSGIEEELLEDAIGEVFGVFFGEESLDESEDLEEGIDSESDFSEGEELDDGDEEDEESLDLGGDGNPSEIVVEFSNAEEK